MFRLTKLVCPGCTRESAQSQHPHPLSSLEWTLKCFTSPIFSSFFLFTPLPFPYKKYHLLRNIAHKVLLSYNLLSNSDKRVSCTVNNNLLCTSARLSVLFMIIEIHVQNTKNVDKSTTLKHTMKWDLGYSMRDSNFWLCLLFSSWMLSRSSASHCERSLHDHRRPAVVENQDGRPYWGASGGGRRNRGNWWKGKECLTGFTILKYLTDKCFDLVK